VRLFNPFYNRSGSVGPATEWLLRPNALSRRMHKQGVDRGQPRGIVGGRNIGDEYFGASEHSNFSDLDVLLAGPIVADVSSAFDAYWNSPNAVPVSRFDGRPPDAAKLQQLVAGAQEYLAQAGDTPYVAALRDAHKRGELLANQPRR